ncbi:AbiJ-NTD4 domain-containing protein [Nodularia sp. UHCC 0506]|uniref:AbiJ-NTD4 domain-containing protein n=1 Tax=Nodularia sp. UHCC 0506 TaxID=3110243 RepID=UPI002B21C012|nr:hypothetical protein [Nodularia sp. UHCC 0506]MEA5516495.1 hypothetical protein [Nodularia sp. UHCC 0506]
MDTFSQRHGFKPKREIMQIESMNQDLRNSLWNVLVLLVWEKLEKYYQDYGPIDYSSLGQDFEVNEIKSLIWLLWFSHFKQTLDTLTGVWTLDFKFIKTLFFKYQWHEVYDFLEFIATNYKSNAQLEKFIDLCNHVLEREMSGYRFIGSIITPITSETEIKAIEEALASEDKLALVSQHINTAITHLSRKENPDYRNSIKESISAVESICRLIANDNKTTLGKALNIIEKQQKVALNGLLKEAYSKLYGYTSGAEGIRHALLDESNLDFEDAKFMLVSCSAFINYLKGKAIQTGIEFKNQQPE